MANKRKMENLKNLAEHFVVESIDSKNFSAVLNNNESTGDLTIFISPRDNTSDVDNALGQEMKLLKT